MKSGNILLINKIIKDFNITDIFMYDNTIYYMIKNNNTCKYFINQIKEKYKKIQLYSTTIYDDMDNYNYLISEDLIENVIDYELMLYCKLIDNIMGRHTWMINLKHDNNINMDKLLTLQHIISPVRQLIKYYGISSKEQLKNI